MEQVLDKNLYLNDLLKIKETINSIRTSAIYVVNSAMIITYYQIGTIINQRKEWGNKYVERLSRDLKEYGKGYSYPQLEKMSQFAAIFTIDEIGSQPVNQIPWGTLYGIISKSSSKEEMLWYINQTHKNKWSRAAVLKQFELKAYQRHEVEPISSPIKADSDGHIRRNSRIFS